MNKIKKLLNPENEIWNVWKHPIWIPITTFITLMGIVISLFGITFHFDRVFIFSLLVFAFLGAVVLIAYWLKKRKSKRQSLSSRLYNPQLAYPALNLSQQNIINQANGLFPRKRPALLIISLTIIVCVFVLIIYHLRYISINTSIPMFRSLVYLSGVVNNVEYSHNGRYIAIAENDGTVSIWNATNGKRLFSFHNSGGVNSLVWSTDDTLIALEDPNGIVQIVNAANGKQVSFYAVQDGSVNGVTWSPNDYRIASAYNDGTVHVWDVIDGTTVYTFHGVKKKEGAVNAVAWSPNGLRIASAYDDGTIQIWDATAGKNVLIYTDPQGSVDDLAWSPDGTRIASSNDVGTMHIWDTLTGGKDINDTYGRLDDQQIYAITWGSDSEHIAFAKTDGTVQEYFTVNGSNLINYSKKGGINALSWSPDLARIVSVDDDGTIQIWNPSSGTTIFTLNGTSTK